MTTSGVWHHLLFLPGLGRARVSPRTVWGQHDAEKLRFEIGGGNAMIMSQRRTTKNAPPSLRFERDDAETAVDLGVEWTGRGEGGGARVLVSPMYRRIEWNHARVRNVGDACYPSVRVAWLCVMCFWANAAAVHPLKCCTRGGYIQLPGRGWIWIPVRKCQDVLVSRGVRSLHF